MNGDGKVVADDSACYDMDCQICEPMHECQALLRTLERVLTDRDGPFGLPCGRKTPTVETDPSSVEEGGRETGQFTGSRPEGKEKRQTLLRLEQTPHPPLPAISAQTHPQLFDAERIPPRRGSRADVQQATLHEALCSFATREEEAYYRRLLEHGWFWSRV